MVIRNHVKLSGGLAYITDKIGRGASTAVQSLTGREYHSFRA